MATWPATLPATSFDGYTLTQKDQTIRTDMEAGNPRVRRRSAARIDEVDVAWVMTDAQVSDFRTWFEDGTSGAAGGAAWFTITLNTGTGAPSSISARFIGAFNTTLVGPGQWRVTAKLETRT